MKETIKVWYNDERFLMYYHNNALIAKFVQRGILTPEDYEEITGEEYIVA